MDFTPRPLADERDLQRIRALIQAAWKHYGPYVYYHVAYLCLRMREESYLDWLTLWETPAGELAGFSESDGGMFEWQVHPRYVHSTLVAHILEWNERADTWRGWRGTKLDTLCAEEDSTAAASLEQRGYVRTAISYQHHLASLTDTIQLPSLPAGYHVRPLAASDGIEARVAAHCAGWERASMTVAVYRRLMQTSCYRPELDLVVTDASGEIAACCNVWVDEANGVGVFEPLSTRPEQRGRRLAQALVCKGMQQLRALGATQALVLSASESPHVARLYERCGLPIARRDFLYQKQVEGV
jgi:GNAT superfamily N-acetyltransferase